MDYRDLLGKAFKDGARGPEAYDCLGLAIEILRRYNIEIKDYQYTVDDWRDIMDELNNWERCDPLDLPVPCVVVMKVNSLYCNHVGVYIGNGKFIHISRALGVLVSKVDNPRWRNIIHGFYQQKGGWKNAQIDSTQEHI